MEVVVREVYSKNLYSEFRLIMKHLPYFPIVSMDTEFPGTVHNPYKALPAHIQSTLSPSAFYKVLKSNVDSLKLIQVGLTLSNAHGKLPTVGGTQVAWEFNFRDFDYETDIYNAESISLLQRQGIDFERNRKEGIDSGEFAKLFGPFWLDSEDPRSTPFRKVRVEWVTFQGSYDFGFLIKVLTGAELPDDVDAFLDLVWRYFGPEVYDMKTWIRHFPHFGLYGGLDRVAKSLNLDRVAGKSHQAGSDSLLTMDVFHKLYNKGLGDEVMSKKMWGLNHMVYGLTTVG